MRRKDREVTDFNTIVGVVDECSIVRIGLSDGNFPYIVPLNFAYTVEDGQLCLYIHGARAGKKFEMMTSLPFCSFEMDIPVRMDCNTDAKSVTMRYKSVMGKCNIEFLEGEEKQSAFDDIIMARYEQTRNFEYNQKMIDHTAVARLIVTELSCKINPICG